MTDWVRLWHDMPTDPKWRTIARKSGQRIGDVIAVFNFLMVNASGNASERGKLNGFDIEDVATALDLGDDDVQSILDAMQGKVIDGDRLAGWDKRQPKREDSSASQRKAEWKERQRNAAERNGTQRNAAERPETETETDIPLSNDKGRDPEKEFWDSAKQSLIRSGKSQSQAGSLIGKWLKENGKELTTAAINAAQLERAVDPVGYVQGYLRRHKAPGPASGELATPC